MQNGPALIDGSPERHAGRRHNPEVPGTPASNGPDHDIRLTLSASAENVVLVRHVVGALADALGMAPTTAADVKLAVTEACTNVVRHAYGDTSGSLEVEVLPRREAFVVTVTDRGRGLHPSSASGGAGLGLPLMAALANALEIDQPEGCGNRVRMSFRPDR